MQLYQQKDNKQNWCERDFKAHQRLTNISNMPFSPSHHPRTSVPLLAVSCCPSSTASFVSSSWRSLLSSRQQDQIKRCTKDGWAASEWKIGGQAMIFPAFSVFSFHLFAALCQIDDMWGKYYWFCFHGLFRLVLLSVVVSILMTELRNET